MGLRNQYQPWIASFFGGEQTRCLCQKGVDMSGEELCSIEKPVEYI
jgi:hypothetical protein